MSFELVCQSCGAPSGPSVGVCPFCKSVMTQPQVAGSATAGPPGKFAALEGMIRQALSEGKLQDALLLASEAAKTHAELMADSMFLVLYAEVLIETEGPTSMIRGLLTRVKLTQPDNIQAALMYQLVDARAKFTKNMNDQGEIEIRKILKTHPDYTYALFILGAHLFWIQEIIPESQKLLERCVQKRPGFLRAWGCLAEIYRKSGNIAAAGQAYRKCVSLESDPTMRKFFEDALRKVSS